MEWWFGIVVAGFGGWRFSYRRFEFTWGEVGFGGSEVGDLGVSCWIGRG